MFAANIPPRKSPNSATVLCGFLVTDRDADPGPPQSRGPIVAMQGQTMQLRGHTDRPASRPCSHLNQFLALPVIGSRRSRRILTDIAKNTVASAPLYKWRGAVRHFCVDVGVGIARTLFEMRRRPGVGPAGKTQHSLRQQFL